MTESSSVYPPQALAVPVQVRFGDMDAYGHVNNVSVLRLLEEARSRLLVDGLQWTDSRVLVARQEIEYRAVLHYSTADPQIHIWTSRVGGASFELSYAVEDPSGQTTAVAATTIVVIDEHSRPTPIPDEARAKLDKLSGPPIAFRGR
ncbi:MAG: acyl-CoA thioesterase [Segniliparus sp.]|uniref:acyl-CoA thioesterase n=1 Tax=Segniliparus sp. TaxID=2804064 RepID=UPI003F4009A8